MNVKSKYKIMAGIKIKNRVYLRMDIESFVESDKGIQDGNEGGNKG